MAIKPPTLRPWASDLDNTATRAQRIKALKQTLKALKTAVRMVARNCPADLLLPYYIEELRREFKQRDKKLSRESDKLVWERYIRDNDALDRLPSFLKLAIERAHKSSGQQRDRQIKSSTSWR